jgi:hypothetical protein
MICRPEGMVENSGKTVNYPYFSRVFHTFYIRQNDSLRNAVGLPEPFFFCIINISGKGRRDTLHGSYGTDQAVADGHRTAESLHPDAGGAHG